MWVVDFSTSTGPLCPVTYIFMEGLHKYYILIEPLSCHLETFCASCNFLQMVTLRITRCMLHCFPSIVALRGAKANRGLVAQFLLFSFLTHIFVPRFLLVILNSVFSPGQWVAGVRMWAGQDAGRPSQTWPAQSQTPQHEQGEHNVASM